MSPLCTMPQTHRLSWPQQSQWPLLSPISSIVKRGGSAELTMVEAYGPNVRFPPKPPLPFAIIAGRCDSELVRRLLFTAAILLSVPTPALVAQPRAPGPPNDIVITAHVKEALRRFVLSLSKEGPTGQIARWDGYVCPTVVGLQSDEAQFMEQRILDIGHSAHLRPWGSGCTTSFIVVFTPDAGAFAAALVREYPVSLRTDGEASLKAFLNSVSPVRWISVSNECGGSGCELPNSRLLKSTKPTLQAMVVVVDASRVGGYSIGELSDYVALVGLTNPKASANQPLQSILSMFNTPRAPGTQFELTAYDKAFLSGVYDTRLDDSGEGQRATIVNRMGKEIDGNRSRAGQNPPR